MPVDSEPTKYFITTKFLARRSRNQSSNPYYFTTEAQSSEYFLIQNSLLRALRASAVRSLLDRDNQHSHWKICATYANYHYCSTKGPKSSDNHEFKLRVLRAFVVKFVFCSLGPISFVFEESHSIHEAHAFGPQHQDQRITDRPRRVHRARVQEHQVPRIILAGLIGDLALEYEVEFTADMFVL